MSLGLVLVTCQTLAFFSIVLTTHRLTMIVVLQVGIDNLYQIQNNVVSGPHQEYTSFAIFEHISYKLTIYFAVKDDTACGEFRGYKIEIAYASIHTITVDCVGVNDGDDNQYMYLRLRHPPTVRTIFSVFKSFKTK